MGFDSGVLQPGNIFGRDFQVLRALKAGGMGAVYVVEQLSTGKQRALKVMNPELSQDPATRERFVLEARAASQIDSDHVVEVVRPASTRRPGRSYLVMELLRGEELEDAQARLGPLPVGDVAEVPSQVGHALERAHAMGIVHRDLKPQNIFLAASRQGLAFTAKILDFGIAKLVADNKQTSTQALGSPLFMSPEQTDSKGRISPATDVWALGLITFSLLTSSAGLRRETESLLRADASEIVVDLIPLASERLGEIGVADKLPVGFDAVFAAVREPRCPGALPRGRRLRARLQAIWSRAGAPAEHARDPGRGRADEPVVQRGPAGVGAPRSGASCPLFHRKAVPGTASEATGDRGDRAAPRDVARGTNGADPSGDGSGGVATDPPVARRGAGVAPRCLLLAVPVVLAAAAGGSSSSAQAGRTPMGSRAPGPGFPRLGCSSASATSSAAPAWPPAPRHGPRPGRPGCSWARATSSPRPTRCRCTACRSPRSASARPR